MKRYLDSGDRVIPGDQIIISSQSKATAKQLAIRLKMNVMSILFYLARFYQIATFCLSIIIFHLSPFSSIFEMLIKCYTMETSGISFGYQYTSTRIARKWCTIQGPVVVHSETNVHHHHNIHNQQHHHLRIGSA